MATKSVSPPFTIIASSVSATTTYTSSISSILYKDNVSLQFAISGAPTGTLDVQVSNDYNAGTPQSGGDVFAGTWTSVVQSSPNQLPVSIGSGSTSIAINMNQLGFAFIRVQYTNSGGSGSVVGMFTAKSLG